MIPMKFLIREMIFLGDYYIHPVQYLFTASYYTVNMPSTSRHITLQTEHIYSVYSMVYTLHGE